MAQQHDLSFEFEEKINEMIQPVHVTIEAWTVSPSAPATSNYPGHPASLTSCEGYAYWTDQDGEDHELSDDYFQELIDKHLNEVLLAISEHDQAWYEYQKDQAIDREIDRMRERRNPDTLEWYDL